MRSDPGSTTVAKPKKMGTAKAVDTMFRNAVRAELDLITLAATKANIMIQLNGFIISALVISGALLFNTNTSLLIAGGVFMLTSAGSIVFALLAASPERADLGGSVWRWARDVGRRQAGLMDLRSYVMRGRDRRPGELNPLIYEDRIQLAPEVHWERMQELIGDREDIYHKMSDHLHWLGEMANRKFKLLNISYSVFRWGLVATVLVFVVCRMLFGIFPGLASAEARTTSSGVTEFRSIYEPSGAQALPDGRILVAEDESKRAFSLVRPDGNGVLHEEDAPDLQVIRGFGVKLDDLEAMTSDERGFIYATTSHSVDKSGQRSADREHLVRFKITGRTVGEISLVDDLRDAIVDSSLPGQIAELSGEDEPDMEELNIEGMTYDAGTGHLLLGLREPLAGDDRAVIVSIDNPDDVFAGRPPVFGPPMLVDIDAGGIRSLSFDPVMEDFLIVNEVTGPDGSKHSRLWHWAGTPDEEPELMDLPGIDDLTNVEAMDSIVVDGEPALVLMSDEGEAKKQRPGRYLVSYYSEFLD